MAINGVFSAKKNAHIFQLANYKSRFAIHPTKHLPQKPSLPLRWSPLSHEPNRGKDMSKDKRSIQKLRREVEKTKRALSSTHQAMEIKQTIHIFASKFSAFFSFHLDSRGKKHNMDEFRSKNNKMDEFG
jgi:hypothetical protein